MNTTARLTLLLLAIAYTSLLYPSSPDIQLEVTKEDFLHYLNEEIALEQEELNFALTETSNNESEEEISRIEIRALKKSIAHRLSIIDNIDVSFLHFQDHLTDSIETLTADFEGPELEDIVEALRHGYVKEADQLLAGLCKTVEADKVSAAQLFYQRGKLADHTGDIRLALKHYTRSTVINPDEIKYLIATGDLAEQMGFISAAVLHLQEALAISETNTLDERFDKIDALKKLATAYHSNGYYRVALECANVSIDEVESIGDAPEFMYSSPMNIKGLCLISLGKYEEALEIHRQCLEIDKRAFGKTHKHVAVQLNNIAACLQRMGRPEEALQSQLESLQLTKLHFNSDDIEYAASLINLGVIYSELDKSEEALKCYSEAEKIFVSSLGEDHPQVSACWTSMGLILIGKREFPAALKYLTSAHLNNIDTYGENSPRLSMTANNLGLYWLAVDKPATALEYFKQAHELLKPEVDADEQQLERIDSNIRLCLEKL